MSGQSLGLFLGLLSYVLVNVGMGVQKQGAEVLSHPKAALRTPRNRRLLAVWGVGTAMTTLAVLVQFKALELAPASVVASFGGFGLATLVVYSAFVLREPIGRLEMAAIGLIVVGTGVAGYFGAGEAGRAVVRLGPLAVYCLAVLVVMGAGTWWALALRREAAGLCLALASGVLGGLAVMLQKAVAARSAAGAEGLADQASRMAVDPLLWLFVVGTTAAFVVMQLSFQYDRAVVIVPAYTVSSMLAPIMGAPAAFDEAMTPALLVGLSLLIAGVLLLARSGGTTLEAAAA